MFSERAKTLQSASLFLDGLCICTAFGLAFVLRVYHGSIPFLGRMPAVPWTGETVVSSDYAVFLGLSLIAWVGSIRSSGVYRSPRAEQYSTIVLTYARALALALLATSAVAFVLKMGSVSRVFFGYYFGTAFVLLLAKQTFVISVLRKLRATGVNQRHALIIGAGQPAAWFAKVLTGARETGYNLIGMLRTKKVLSLEDGSIPVIGTIEDLDTTLTNHPVDEVFVVGGAADIAELAPIAQGLIEKGRVVSLVTPMAGGSHGMRGRVTEFSGIPMISFGPMPRDEVGSGVKRAIDVAVSAPALLLLSPVLALVALAMKILDPGPVLFSQKRLGIAGEQFRLYKFRSMRVDAEQALKADANLYRRYLENDYKLPEDEDPRISPLGRFLRKSSLDELPQLWNVLKGDMTLVGPRPIVPAEIEKYRPYENLFLAARPGITGQWQVSGRSDVQYPERAYLDLDYIGFNSIMSDLEIMWRTVPAVLLRRGAH